MNRLDKAAYNQMVAVVSLIHGACVGLAEIKTPRIAAACHDEELRAWPKMARQSARILMEFAARFENNSASGIAADEEATSAARYLGGKGGRIGGRKGGVARMDALTTEQRRELGRMAAAARWKDKPAKGK